MYVYNTQCIIYIYIYSIMLHGGEMGEIGESMCFELRCAEECQFRDSWLDTLYSGVFTCVSVFTLVHTHT